MKRTGSFIVVLICVSILGMMVVGCDTPTGGETDSWTTVVSLDQINGTWKGAYSQSMTIKQAMEESGETWTSEMQTMFGDMKVTASVDMTSTINSSAKTQSLSMVITQIYSGGNIAIVWTMISAGYSGQSGVTVNNEKHSITMTQNMPTQTISDGDLAEMLGSGLQINQTGTKIRMPANSIMGDGSPELILTKQ
jgi:hypothetical protein